MMRTLPSTPWLLFLVLLAGGCTTAPERVLTQQEVEALGDSASERGAAADQDWEMDSYDSDALLRMTRTEFDFHGVVRTESGAPVVAARIDTIIYDRFNGDVRMENVSGVRPAAVFTDAEGTFRIKDQGAEMIIEVNAEGYRATEAVQRTYYFAEELIDRNKWPLPSKVEPAEFVFRELSAPDEIKVIVSGGIEFDSPRSTLGYSFRTENPYGIDPDEADIVFDLKASDPDDWTAVISVPGGGIRTVGDLLATRAPAEGYRDSLTISGGSASMRPGKENVTVFLKLSDETYAKATIGVRVGSNTYFYVESLWNTIGELDLR